MRRVLETYGGSNDVLRVVKLNTASSKMIRLWLNIRSHSLTGEGGRYVICYSKAGNMDVVALYLSERLNNNLYYTLEHLIFQFVYIFFCLSFFCQSEEKFVKYNRNRKDKFSDSQIFLFDEGSKSSQGILLTFGLSLLLLFHRTSFAK